MMKILFKFSLFIILAAGLAGLTACEKSAGSEKQKKSDYPAAPEAIMKAELKLVDGTTIKLEDKKGKVVLVNLWATWCGPCRSEMPELIKLQDKYRDQGFEVIGLDTDENETPEQIKEFAAEMKLNYTLGMADDKFFNEFVKLTRQPAIPQSMLINRDGQMTGMFTGAGGSLMEKLKKTVETTVAE